MLYTRIFVYYTFVAKQPGNNINNKYYVYKKQIDKIWPK